MPARKKAKKDYCSECGAELRLRPASCPLCGAEVTDKSWSATPVSAEDYQSNVRDLREQLRKLRNDGAEAV
jgi:predicted amidophosphoribosyltransferase